MPQPVYPWNRPGTHCTEGWVGPRAGLGRCGKVSPPPGFDPRTVPPVATRYTDYTTQPTKNYIVGAKNELTLYNCSYF